MRYLLILLLLTSSFIYSSEKEDEAKECASITDINKRLSCYDSIFTKQKIEDPKLIASKKKQEEKVVSQDKEIKKEKERRFGLPKRQVIQDEKVAIRNKIVNVKKLADLRLDITLENGQKWRSVEKIRQIRLKENQKVIISEGFISGYVLKVIDKKISLRVRRIK